MVNRIIPTKIKPSVYKNLSAEAFKNQIDLASVVKAIYSLEGTSIPETAEAIKVSPGLIHNVLAGRRPLRPMLRDYMNQQLGFDVFKIYGLEAKEAKHA